MQHVIVLLDIAGAKADIDAIIRDGNDQARILTFEEPDGAAAAAEGLRQARRRNLDEEPAPIIVAAAGGADTEDALTAIRLVRAITQRVPLLLIFEEADHPSVLKWVVDAGSRRVIQGFRPWRSLDRHGRGDADRGEYQSRTEATVSWTA